MAPWVWGFLSSGSCGLFFRGRYKTSKVFFLLVLSTASYAAPKKQQSLPLFLGVAPGKLHQPANKQGLFLACFIYGLLCRTQETAIITAVSWCGAWQATSTGEHTRSRYELVLSRRSKTIHTIQCH
ncbi:MAG: hypothetical protein K0A99_09610 [Desulfoarculaceae bacterium]|nr:hypothetical protein [Desulfoarculaceae bacterium]